MTTPRFEQNGKPIRVDSEVLVAYSEGDADRGRVVGFSEEWPSVVLIKIEGSEEKWFSSFMLAPLEDQDLTTEELEAEHQHDSVEGVYPPGAKHDPDEMFAVVFFNTDQVRNPIDDHATEVLGPFVSEAYAESYLRETSRENEAYEIVKFTPVSELMLRHADGDR